MGYYIEVPGQLHGKAEAIADIHGGKFVDYETAKVHVEDPETAVIVVLDNGPFEAAGYAYNMNEFKAFTDPLDQRKKSFLLLPRKKVQELTGCDR